MTFRIEFFTRNIEMTESIKNYVEKKMNKLERFLDDIDEARIDLSHIKSARNAADRQVAQITLHGRGFILRTEERADDIFAAFDAALAKMQRQVERFKGKRARGRGDGRSAAEVVGEMVEEQGEEKEMTIVRRKSFEVEPMTEMEALEQMRFLGHDNFFIFFNVETNAFNVLYQRRNGTYGLIEPKIG